MTDFSQVLPVPEGDPLKLDQAGAQLVTQAQNMAKHGERFKAEGSGLQQHWESPEAAGRATAQVGTLHRTSADLSERLGQAGKAAQAYAEKLRAAQLKAKQLQFQAEEAERQAQAEAARQPDQASASQVFRQRLDAALQQLQKEHQAMKADLDQAATDCARALHDLSPTTQQATNLSGATAQAENLAEHPHDEKLTELGGRGSDGLTPPPAGTDPRQAKAWWGELTDEEKQAVIATSHRELGNLGGIPADARSAANELSVAEDLKSTDPTVRQNATQVQQAMTNARQVVDPVSKEQTPAQLLSYDPKAFNGDGRAAIAVGDVDHAKNVAMIVPGITTTVDSQMVHTTGQAANVYEEARKAAPGASTAVVAWIGYDAPSGSGLVPETAGWQKAQDGSVQLANDINDLRTERDGDQPHLTVLAHSYGTVTSALAITQQGARVDDFVALGSPGLPVSGADGLTGSGHVFAGANSHDVVAGLQRFGIDPASSLFPGGQRIEAQDDSVIPYTLISGHLHYFDQNSESLYSMGNITVGNYDKVLTAPGFRFTGVIDTESFRTPTHPTN
jgi:Alpha/beta hydrolase